MTQISELDEILHNAEVSAEVKCVLRGIKATIEERKGNPTGNPPSATEYFGALSTLLVGIAVEDDGDRNHEDGEDEPSGGHLAAPLFLLTRLLPEVPQSVVQFRFDAVATPLMRILQLHTRDEDLVKSCICTVKEMCLKLNPALLSRALPARCFRAMLVLSVDPRDEVRTTARNSLCQALLAFDPVPKTLLELMVKCSIHEIDNIASDDPMAPVFLMEALAVVLPALRHPRAVTLVLAKLLAHIRLNPLPVLHQNTLGLFKCLFTRLRELEGHNSVCKNLVKALQEIRPLPDDSVTVGLFCKTQAAMLACSFHLDPELGDEQLLSSLDFCLRLLATNRVAVIKSGTNAIRQMLLTHVDPLFLERSAAQKANLPNEPSVAEQLVKKLLTLLDFEYKTVWAQTFGLFRTLFHRLGPAGAALAEEPLRHLGATADEVRDPEGGMMKLSRPLDRAIGKAIESFGPAFVFKQIPHQLPTRKLVKENGIGPATERVRRWMLPLLKSHVRRGDLQWFGQHLVGAAEELRHLIQDAERGKRQLAQRFYEGLFNQVWECFPAFCASLPKDAAARFGKIGPILGRLLTNLRPARKHILRGLTLLITSAEAICQLDTEKAEAEDEEMGEDGADNSTIYDRVTPQEAVALIKAIRPFSVKFLPVIFNCLIEAPPAERAPAAAAVRAFCSIAPDEVVGKLFLGAQAKFKEMEKSDPEAWKHVAFSDVLVALALHLPKEHCPAMMETAVKPFVNSTDALLQKRAYSIFLTLIARDDDAAGGVKAACDLLIEAGPKVRASGRRKRLECVVELINKHPDPERILPDLVNPLLAEVVQCTKEAAPKLRKVAHLVVGTAGRKLHAHDLGRWLNTERKPTDDPALLTQLAGALIGGLACDTSLMQSGTILALASLVHQCRRMVDPQLVKKLLDAILLKFSDPSRDVLKASLKFTKTCITVLPVPILETVLPDIVDAVFRERVDPTNKFQKKVRYLTESLLRRFGHAKVQALVPEKHHKLLSHIRKEARRKRTRSERGSDKSGPLTMLSATSRLSAFSLRSGPANFDTASLASRRSGRSSRFYTSTVWQDSDDSDGAGGGQVFRAENRVRIREAGEGDDPIDLAQGHTAAAGQDYVQLVEETRPNTVEMGNFGGGLVLGEDDAMLDNEGNFVFGDERPDKKKKRGKPDDSSDDDDGSDEDAGRARKRQRVNRAGPPKPRKKKKPKKVNENPLSYALHVVKPGLLAKRSKGAKKAKFKDIMAKGGGKGRSTTRAHKRASRGKPKRKSHKKKKK